MTTVVGSQTLGHRS